MQHSNCYIADIYYAMAFLIIIILIILNGYFSLAEIALISVNKNELSEEKGNHNPSAFQVLKLIEKPEEFLSAIQVGITLLSLLEGIYGGSMVADQLKLILVHLGMSEVIAHISSLIIGIGLITYLTIVFGELVPKSIALQMPLKVSLAIAPSLNLISKVLFPFIKLLTWSTRFILDVLSIKRNDSKKISENDIKQMLGTAYKQGLVGKQQLWMHENVWTFTNLTAQRIMKPAKIVAAVNYSWGRDLIIDLMKKKPYSYFPVYKEEAGNIVGLISTKKFFLNDNPDWHQLILSGCTIPADMPAKDIFTRFKEKKADFGLVIDDQTNYLGIVSMQDIMEGVFGDIPEIDDYSAYFYAKSDKIWIAEGFVHLQRIRIKLSFPWLRDYEAKYLTLSELMQGEIPDHEIQNTLVIKGVSFTILEESNHEAPKIMITIP